MRKSKYIGCVINDFEIMDSYNLKDYYMNTIYVCKCIFCGNIKHYSCSTILNNKAKCFCKRKRKYRNGFDSKSRLYNIYRSIIKRTQNPNNKDYHRYGGRGISLCEEWNNDYSKFYDWSMNNGYNDTLTIDRINVNGNYEPNNCRWVDVKTQINNTRFNHRLTYNGETHTLKEWSEKIGMNYGTLKERIYNGWSIEKAINEPVKYKNRSNKCNTNR